MKKTAQNGNAGIILVILLLVTLGIYLISNPKNQIARTVEEKSQATTSKPNNMSTKTFKSNYLTKYTIELPSNYKISEKLDTVTIGASTGNIYIDKNGTNYSNLDEYLKDLASKNHLVLNKKTNLVISNKPSINGFIENEKIYFILVDYTVYNIHTDSPSLYPDLDQIAQSFHYTP